MALIINGNLQIKAKYNHSLAEKQLLNATVSYLVFSTVYILGTEKLVFSVSLCSRDETCMFVLYFQFLYKNTNRLVFSGLWITRKLFLLMPNMPIQTVLLELPISH